MLSTLSTLFGTETFGPEMGWKPLVITFGVIAAFTIFITILCKVAERQSSQPKDDKW